MRDGVFRILLAIWLESLFIGHFDMDESLLRGVAVDCFYIPHRIQSASFTTYIILESP